MSVAKSWIPGLPPIPQCTRRLRWWPCTNTIGANLKFRLQIFPIVLFVEVSHMLSETPKKELPFCLSYAWPTFLFPPLYGVKAIMR